MKNTSYNGWTNYATWRIYNEIFADFDFDYDFYGNDKDKDFCQDFAEEVIFNDTPDGLAKDYAYAFLRDVNWYEISEHINENFDNQ